MFRRVCTAFARQSPSGVVARTESVAGVEHTSWRGTVPDVAVAPGFGSRLNRGREVELEAILPVVVIHERAIDGAGYGDDRPHIIGGAVVEGQRTVADSLFGKGNQVDLDSGRAGFGRGSGTPGRSKGKTDTASANATSSAKRLWYRRCELLKVIPVPQKGYPSHVGRIPAVFRYRTSASYAPAIAPPTGERSHCWPATSPRGGEFFDHSPYRPDQSGVKTSGVINLRPRGMTSHLPRLHRSCVSQPGMPE